MAGKHLEGWMKAGWGAGKLCLRGHIHPVGEGKNSEQGVGREGTWNWW